MQFGPRLFSADQSRWPHHGVERYVVLAHELVQLNIFLILPPLFPLVCVISCYRDVTNRGVKPHIEDFVCKLFDGDWCAPLEVASNAPAI